MQRYSFLDIQAFVNVQYKNNPNYIQPYGYTITVPSLAPAATYTASLSITANADFVLTGLKYRATIAAAAQTVSNKTAACVRVLITDSGTNQQFSQSAVDLENYSTNGGDSRDLPYPRFIQGRTALSIAFTSYAAAETYAPLDLFLEGVQTQMYTTPGG